MQYFVPRSQYVCANLVYANLTALTYDKTAAKTLVQIFWSQPTVISLCFHRLSKCYQKLTQKYDTFRVKNTFVARAQAVGVRCVRVNLFFEVKRSPSEMLQDTVTLNQCEQVIHDICGQKSYAKKKPILRQVETLNPDYNANFSPDHDFRITC